MPQAELRTPSCVTACNWQVLSVVLEFQAKKTDRCGNRSTSSNGACLSTEGTSDSHLPDSFIHTLASSLVTQAGQASEGQSSSLWPPQGARSAEGKIPQTGNACVWASPERHFF